MDISSRTPEGSENHCPVCGQFVRMTPSEPTGDAPCPHCGCLLWFIDTGSELRFYARTSISPPLESEPGQVKIPFHADDRVKVADGTFEEFEGSVLAVDESNGRVTIEIKIFGRDVPVELEWWQLEAVKG